MSIQSEFIHAISENPSDEAARLVCADWLDEHNEPHAAEYLRAELELAKLPIDATAAPALRHRLWQAWANVSPQWLMTFTQPGMLLANPTPFSPLWINFSLGKIRPGQHTYDSWPYESLPPLQELGTMDGFFAPDPENPHDPKEHRRKYNRMTKDIDKLGIRLPPAFAALMKDRVPQFAVRSPTDCFFDLPDDFTRVRLAKSGDAAHVHFFCDSQSCMLWDLYIHKTGAHCVVARNLDYFESLDPEDDPPPSGPGAWFVAPSLELFIHRIWIENNAWYHEHADAFDDGDGGSPPAQSKMIDDYVNHYRKQAKTRKPHSKS
jgi:uncharacterized protein (TIGR02996 family)